MTTPKDKQVFRMEGNKGGDYLYLEQISDNMLSIEVGNCCVTSIHHIIPIEFLTALLVEVGMEAAPDTHQDICIEMAKKYLRWDNKYKQQLINKIRPI